MKPFVIASTLLAAVLGLTAQAQSDSSDKTSHRDNKFIENAAEANLSQVELGKLGTQKTQNDQVKQLAQNLQTDHQKANDQLQPIAQTAGVKLPDKIDHKHQRELSRLEKLSGAEFDKEFATVALRQHADTLDMFQKEAQKGENSATKGYAQNLLPSLQQHLDMAKDVAKSVGVEDSKISSILKHTEESTGGATSPGGVENSPKPQQ